MSSVYTITCKKECSICEYLGLYKREHKYPFRCYRTNQSNNPAIKTSPFCGGHFITPNIKLKRCKYYKVKKVWPK